MKHAISKRPTQLCNNLASSVGLVADQWVCGACDCDEWFVFNSIKVDALILQCADCGAYYVLRNQEAPNEAIDILAGPGPGSRARRRDGV